MNTLDMLGKPCPIPVIEAKKALRALPVGETLQVLVDNEAACQNLEKMAAGLSHSFAFAPEGEGDFRVSITVGAAGAASEGGGLVVAIGRECMGEGSDELGAMLMKSYIYSLTELDTPPEQLLFFNGGVRLACEGAATLEDLRALAEKGTRISACGACLNYYTLSEQLAVGSVTNMYAIAATMAAAPRLVNL